MALEARALGRTGASVSILGYGALELRGEPRGRRLADEHVGRLLNEVIDAGVTLIDTSVDYGRSEELIGRHLAQRREEYFLASKCGCTVGLAPDTPSPYPHDYSPSNVRAGVEHSLRTLRTDHLDLVQVHASPSRARLAADDVLTTLSALRDEGKVRLIGMSGILPDLPDHIAMDAFDVFQIPYSVVQREHEDLITAARRAGAGTLIRGGAARDVLEAARVVNGTPDLPARRAARLPHLADVLDGMPVTEFALRFTLSHPEITSTVVGTASIEHLRANVAIAEKGALPKDVYDEVRRRLDAESGAATGTR